MDKVRREAHESTFKKDLEQLQSGELDLVEYLARVRQKIQGTSAAFEERLAKYKRHMQDLKGASNKSNSLYHEVICERVDKDWADLMSQDSKMLQQEGRLQAFIEKLGVLEADE